MARIAFIRHRIIAAIRDEGGLGPAFRKAGRLLRQRGFKHLLFGGELPTEGDYRRWVGAVDCLRAVDLARMQERVAELESGPVFSVLLPAHETPVGFLKSAVESVRRQIYPKWELCIADDASRSPALHRYLDSLDDDPRVRIVRREVNGHISACSNSALELATGDWVVLLDHDDELSEDALFRFAEVIAGQPGVRMIYSDEDKLDVQGRRARPYFKPAFNRELLRANNYICHLAAYRREELNEIGGFRAGFEGAQDHDLALRYTERCASSEIAHVPMILYHWREHSGSTSTGISTKSYALAAGAKAVEEHFARMGLVGTVLPNSRGYYDIAYQLSGPEPSVAIIIPTKNQFELLRKCVGSLRKRTSYHNYQIVLVDNASDCPKALAYLSQLESSGAARVLRDSGPFNFSRLNNGAVREVESEFIVLLNNDIEIIEPAWLTDMVATAMQGDVGVVGAKLHYPDGSIQHAGIVLGIGGSAGHAFKQESKETLGYYFRAVVRSEFSALTGACLLVRRSVYEKVGGLDEDHFGIAFNDVDFCLKVKALNLRNVLCPGARLFHHESKSRGYEDTPHKKARFAVERARLRQKWLPLIDDDPAYNINLTRDKENFWQNMAFSARIDAFPASRLSPDDFDRLALPPVEASPSLISQLKLLFNPYSPDFATILCIGSDFTNLAVALQRLRRDAEVYLLVNDVNDQMAKLDEVLTVTVAKQPEFLPQVPMNLVIHELGLREEQGQVGDLLKTYHSRGAVLHAV